MNVFRNILKDTFGHSGFREGQEEIIQDIYEQKDTFVIMPTGAGKSLCYQLPAIKSDKKTIVISPLISLIDDQTSSLIQLKVPVAKLHSGQSYKENEDYVSQFKSGIYKILYISPERMMSEEMLSTFKKLDIGLIVIDEIHCVSKWGHSFRPEYGKLSNLKSHFPNAGITGFTATVDKTTRLDILDKIFQNKANLYKKPMDRPNLSLNIIQKNNWKSQLLDFLNLHKGQSGIIYCLSRNTTEVVSLFLNEEGFNSSPYHAGMSAESRRTNQDEFMTKTGHIIVATIAFGMGIDKPDIRYVVHLNLPGSMEAYYQEIGRAGRDGQPADTLLIYGLDDLVIRRRMIENAGFEEEYKRNENKRLDYLLSYCETPGCRRKALLNYFEDYVEECKNCDNCAHPPNLLDGTETAQKLLSTIYKTGQYFGQVHIMNVLRGSKDKKVLDRGHHELSVYGIGVDKSSSFWRSFFRQLLAFNHIRINFQKYGAVEITKSGLEILYSRESFSYKVIADEKVDKVRVSKNEKPKIESQENFGLLNELKNLRLELAKENKIPAFIVFHDTSLMEMANLLPRNYDEFLKIDGVGKVKLEKYGDRFIELINDNQNSKNI
jgi:ATP-dependent DNA helicase RecQ